jgi:deoxycytidine triphosphate deaminase
MTVLGPRGLADRVQKGEVLKGLSDRDRDNPEGAGYDLRLADLFQLRGGGSMGVDRRSTSDAAEVSADDIAGEEWFTLQSGAYYLMQTVETVALDLDMVGFIHPRSTLFRSGVLLSSGAVSPGYQGGLTFGLFVAGPFAWTVQRLARVAHINLLQVDDSGHAYRGQWQGGRLVAPIPEEQV